MIGRGALLSLALVASACGASAEPRGPVVDEANILSDATEKALAERLGQYWDQKETAIVVATVPSLKGQTIETAARTLYNDWGIGSAKTNRGVLVLIAPDDRQARIEVGCGLETVVTDYVAKQIMDDDLLPHFKSGEFDTGATIAAIKLIKRIDTANVPAGPVTPYCVEIMKDAA